MSSTCHTTRASELKIGLTVFATSPIPCWVHTCVFPLTPTDVARIFSPSPYAATGNWTRVSSVEPVLWVTLAKDALPTELPRPRQKTGLTWLGPEMPMDTTMTSSFRFRLRPWKPEAGREAKTRWPTTFFSIWFFSFFGLIAKNFGFAFRSTGISPLDPKTDQLWPVVLISLET